MTVPSYNNVFGRLKKSERGSAAVEFAIIAPVFLTIIFSIMEVGWFFTTNAILDKAVQNASREIRTGQVFNLAEYVGDTDPDGNEPDLDDAIFEFYDRVCAIAEIWGTCAEVARVEVQAFTSVAELQADVGNFNCPDTPGISGDYDIDFGTDYNFMRMRVCLIYRTINPAIGINLSEIEGGKRRLYSTIIFRNEPFTKNTPNN